MHLVSLPTYVNLAHFVFFFFGWAVPVFLYYCRFCLELKFPSYYSE